MMVQFDETLGVICTKIVGVQTVQDAHAYMAALSEQVAIAKARTGRALHLVDGRETLVQPAAVAEIYATYDMSMSPVDKVATILTSALLKMQTRRAYNNGTPTTIFDDPDKALAWLLAEEPARATH